MSVTTIFATQIVDNQTKEVIDLKTLAKAIATVEANTDEGLKSLIALSDVNQPITTTPTPYCYEIVNKADGFSLENDCEISSTSGGTFQLALSANFDLTSGGTNRLTTWVEYFDENLGNWIPVEDSGIVREMDKNSEGIISYNNLFDLPANIKIRFVHAMTSGSAQLHTEVINSVGVSSPSVKLNIIKVQ